MVILTFYGRPPRAIVKGKIQLGVRGLLTGYRIAIDIDISRYLREAERIAANIAPVK